MRFIITIFLIAFTIAKAALISTLGKIENNLHNRMAVNDFPDNFETSFTADTSVGDSGGLDLSMAEPDETHLHRVLSHTDPTIVDKYEIQNHQKTKLLTADCEEQPQSPDSKWEDGVAQCRLCYSDGCYDGYYECAAGHMDCTAFDFKHQFFTRINNLAKVPSPDNPCGQSWCRGCGRMQHNCLYMFCLQDSCR